MSKVIVIGGYGGFGARLSRRLARDGWTVLVAGRNLRAAEAFAATLPGALAVAADRSGDLAPLLAEHRPDLLVDAAGPFQGSGYQVPAACIAAGVDYLDLADARDFVAGIAALDAAARRVGVAIVSGASSVPALSGAVVRRLAQGMEAVRAIEMSISASNRATAGASVATAILSYVGRPVRLWRGRRWTEATGWQMLRRETYAIRGLAPLRRLVALVDVPDHAVVRDAVAGAPAVTFRAGPEFAVQVLALWLLSWPVRWGWIRSLAALTPWLRRIHDLTAPLGGERSAMAVEVKGVSGNAALLRRWTLIADRGDGPEIPTLAAHLLARMIADGAVAPGARDAGGLLALDQFDPLFAEHAIRHEIAEAHYAPLYRRVMGERFDRLPLPVRAMHDLCGDGGAVGSARVTRGSSPLARLVCTIMRFPPAGDHAVHVAFEERNGRERWTRDFGGHRFSSELSQAGDALIERFGPLRFRFDLPSDAHGLAMELRGWSAFGIPLPLFLAPRGTAREWAEGEDFRFDVPIALPLIGSIVRYTGRLRIA